MDLNYTPEDHAFRAEVQQFLKEKLPAELAAKTLEGKRLKREDYEFWQAGAQCARLAGAGWPMEFGGTGWTPIQRHIFDEECARGRRAAHPALRRRHGGAGDHGVRH